MKQESQLTVGREHDFAASQLGGTVAALRARFPALLPNDPDYPAFREVDYRAFARLVGPMTSSPILSSFPVDALLQEAGALLERCLVARDAKMDLEVRLLDFWLDYLQFLTQDQIRREQFAAGELSVPATVASAELEVHDRNSISANSIRQATQAAAQLRQPGNPAYDDRVDFASELAWLTSYHRTQAVKDGAGEVARNALVFDAQAADIALSATELACNTHSALRVSAKARADFETANVDFKRRMYEADASTKQIRAALAFTPGIGLNFGWRLMQVQKLFDADFVDAYTRLKAAEIGLSTIFGIVAPLPAAADEKALTDLVLWLRERLTELTALLDREFRTVVVVALDVLLGAGWAAAMTGGVIAFRLDASKHFPRMKLVRLRGLQLFTRDASLDRWQMNVRLPVNGTIQWTDGTDNPLVQNSLPTLVFGDVGARDASYRHGRNEARSVANATPIGDDWILEVAEHSHLGTPRGDISGLDLVLELAVLPA